MLDIGFPVRRSLLSERSLLWIGLYEIVLRAFSGSLFLIALPQQSFLFHFEREMGAFSTFLFLVYTQYLCNCYLRHIWEQVLSALFQPLKRQQLLLCLLEIICGDAKVFRSFA